MNLYSVHVHYMYMYLVDSCPSSGIISINFSCTILFTVSLCGLISFDSFNKLSIQETGKPNPHIL